MHRAQLSSRKRQRRCLLFHGRSCRPFEQSADQRNRSVTAGLPCCSRTAALLKRLRFASCPITSTRFGPCRSMIRILPSDGASSRAGFPGGSKRGRDRKAKRRSAKRVSGRYWEHAIRDDADLARHVDYIHFNPVTHGHVTRVADWPHSSFHRFVERDWLVADWGGGLKDITGSFGE
jgi:hypothetical protein